MPINRTPERKLNPEALPLLYRAVSKFREAMQGTGDIPMPQGMARRLVSSHIAAVEAMEVAERETADPPAKPEFKRCLACNRLFDSRRMADHLAIVHGVAEFGLVESSLSPSDGRPAVAATDLYQADMEIAAQLEELGRTIKSPANGMLLAAADRLREVAGMKGGE